jgi:hypothetical protein
MVQQSFRENIKFIKILIKIKMHVKHSLKGYAFIKRLYIKIVSNFN